MDTAERNLAAGRRLRALREAKNMTQLDVENDSAALHGHENRVYAQQISRIEKGQFDTPPIVQLIHLGEVLGLTPDDIAEMFDLWPRQEKSAERLDPRLREAADLVERLPQDQREELLAQIEFATAMAKAKARARVQEKQ